MLMPGYLVRLVFGLVVGKPLGFKFLESPTTGTYYIVGSTVLLVRTDHPFPINHPCKKYFVQEVEVR